MIIIQKKQFDKEYATSYRSEVLFLRQRQIYYEFAKIIDGISVYKYKKTPELFGALESFYKQCGENLNQDITNNLIREE